MADLGPLGAVTVFVEDLAVASAFYREVLGLPVVYQDGESLCVALGSTVVNLLQADAARELVAPGTVAAPGSGSRLMLSIWVADVDASCAQLTGRGVELLSGPVDRPWGKRTASFADPAGTLWELAQDLPAG